MVIGDCCIDYAERDATLLGAMSPSIECPSDLLWVACFISVAEALILENPVACNEIAKSNSVMDEGSASACSAHRRCRLL